MLKSLKQLPTLANVHHFLVLSILDHSLKYLVHFFLCGRSAWQRWVWVSSPLPVHLPTVSSQLYSWDIIKGRQHLVKPYFFSPNCRSCSLVLRHHAHAWWPHHLIPAQNSVLRHHAHAWCPHRRHFGQGVNVVHTFHRMPVHPPSVRDGGHFANNLRCWAHLHSVLRPNPRRIPFKIRLRRTCGARRFGFVLTHKVLRLTHRVLTYIRPCRSVAKPRCERRSHFSPNCRSCSLVLRHHAYAWCPHHLIPAQNSVLRHQLTLVSSPGVWV